MTRRFSLAFLLLVSTLFLSACSDDSSTNSGDGSNLALGTFQVNVDGVTMPYKVLSSVWSVANNQISINTTDTTDPSGWIRVFINAPNGAKDYPVQHNQEDGKTQIQLTSRVAGTATTTFGHAGNLKILKLTDNEVTATFNFESSIAGAGTGEPVKGTEGAFRLRLTKI